MYEFKAKVGILSYDLSAVEGRSSQDCREVRESVAARRLNSGPLSFINRVEPAGSLGNEINRKLKNIHLIVRTSQSGTQRSRMAVRTRQPEVHL